MLYDQQGVQELIFLAHSFLQTELKKIKNEEYGIWPLPKDFMDIYRCFVSYASFTKIHIPNRDPQNNFLTI